MSPSFLHLKEFENKEKEREIELQKDLLQEYLDYYSWGEPLRPPSRKRDSTRLLNALLYNLERSLDGKHRKAIYIL